MANLISKAKLALSPGAPLALCFCLMATPLAVAAEIYKWVDASGRTHFSDKKHASEQAQRLDAEPEAEDINKNRLVIYPEADALLTQSSDTAQGNSRALSVGRWHTGGTSVQSASLLRFDLSELLTRVNSGPGKRIARAQLGLYANTDDKLYGQGVNNQEPPGHSTLRGDNAFYVMPAHNSWEENKVTWSDYYSSNHYTPSAIRSLPSLAVEGSKSPTQDFDIDVKDLLQKLAEGNVRELTLELKLQRLPTMAQLTFHSREAEPDYRPRLLIELVDSPSP